ncbi:MAG: hypothetical protein SNH88_05690 [Rikenellaceae bacterium]
MENGYNETSFGEAGEHDMMLEHLFQGDGELYFLHCCLEEILKV